MPGDVIFKVDAREIRDGLEPVFRNLPSLLHDVVLVRTLNRTGDMARTVVVKELAKETSIKQREVRSGIRVARATPNHLAYEMAVQGEWLSGLVNLVTQQDDKVCPLCVRAAAHGPYTGEEAEALRHKYAGLSGIVHPNCRCEFVPVERKVRERMARRGDVTAKVRDSIRENMPRIFAYEYKYALDKLAKSRGAK